ncbi:aminodeoxychorismate synthase component I [soil metagenome]
MSPSARFDDLRARTRRGFELGELLRTIEARTLDEVTDALALAEAEVDSGRWVGGWVAYEAGPAFDPALEVISPVGTEFADLPLVWMAVSDRRRPTTPTQGRHHDLGRWESVTTEEHHRDSVEEIRRRIRLGDTYQVNHTFLLRSHFFGDAVVFYDRLTRSQSCGYGAMIDAGEWVVMSASPELFFEWRHGVITCRPMKGTTRRGVDNTDDAAQREWLETSVKNRAENVMIVDMVRNDLGRIAIPGSVDVPELLTTEKYDTVWQLTSTVTARPRLGTGIVDVFGALFPSASITGAPKVSTMGIISALEAHPRGVYTGAIGFGGPGPEGPEWAFNVGIRTVVMRRSDGAAFYGTGGGITYDSDPADEYAEALLKVAVLGRAAGELRLLETTRWDPHQGARNLEAHLQRMAASALYFDIPFDQAEIRAAIDRATRDLRRAVRVRVLVDRDGWVEVETTSLSGQSGPVRLALDDRPIDRLDPLLRHKTTVRHVYEEAADRHPESDDVVLWNTDGEVTETTVGNLAVKLGGRWVTPPNESGLLAGTERAALLESGELTEQVVTLEALEQATGLARLNSVRGWEPAILE